MIRLAFRRSLFITFSLWPLLIGTGLRAAFPSVAAAQEVGGSMAIAGNGPELSVFEKLARSFEKANPRAYVDILWDPNSKPVELVKAGKASLAVTGSEDPDLKATQVAWDGIAVVVNLSNHTKEITLQQVADVFSGKVTSWSDLGGPETKVLVLERPKNANIKEAFERQTGREGRTPPGVKVVASDDKAIKTVVGTLPPLSAVTYLSLSPALEAVTTGVSVRLLPVDKVEPEKPTVKDGRYKLRRPVLLLAKKEPNPLIEAFIAYAFSPAGQTIIDEVYIAIDTKPSAH